MSNSNSTKNWKHGPGVPLVLGSLAFLETPAKLLIKIMSGVDEGGKKNYDTLKKISSKRDRMCTFYT